MGWYGVGQGWSRLGWGEVRRGGSFQGTNQGVPGQVAVNRGAAKGAASRPTCAKALGSALPGGTSPGDSARSADMAAREGPSQEGEGREGVSRLRWLAAPAGWHAASKLATPAHQCAWRGLQVLHASPARRPPTETPPPPPPAMRSSPSTTAPSPVAATYCPSSWGSAASSRRVKTCARRRRRAVVSQLMSQALPARPNSFCCRLSRADCVANGQAGVLGQSVGGEETRARESGAAKSAGRGAPAGARGSGWS